MLSINAFVGYEVVKKSNVEIDIFKPETGYEVNVSGTESNFEQTATQEDTDFVLLDEVFFYKHIASLYDNLMSYDIDVKEVDRELNNVLLAHMVATDLSEQTWHIMFNNLMRTVPREVNVVEYYYPLAVYKHMKDCELDHTCDADGVVSCSDMVSALENYKCESFDEYVFRRVNEMDISSIRDALYRIIGYGYTINDVKGELDTIYKLCTVPMGVDEEVWFNSFAKLLETVNEFENVCEVYYDLANFVHQIECDFTHYTNEFDMTECDAVKRLGI